MMNMLEELVCYGAVYITVGLVLLSFIEEMIDNHKAKKEKRYQLIKLRAEMYAQRRKEEFEAYRAYMENKWSIEPTPNFDELEVIEAEPINFVEGVQKLRDNGHKYVPYERPNPLNDIRNSLSEFTVSDVLNTFYF